MNHWFKAMSIVLTLTFGCIFAPLLVEAVETEVQSTVKTLEKGLGGTASLHSR